MPSLQFNLRTLFWLTAAAIVLCLVARSSFESEYEAAIVGWLCVALIIAAALRE